MRNDIPSDSASNFGARVRETLMTYLGKQGDPLDRGVTLRDLVDSGFATLSNVRFGGGSAPLLTGPSVSGPYVPDLTAPPTPTGFAADAAITNLIVECDAPTYPQGNGHRQSRLYGAKRAGTAPQPVFANAVEITQFAGQVTSYATDPATEWHLWLKWESNDGVLSVNPAGGTNGLVVTTGQDVAKLLEALTGQLTTSQLYADLGSRIELIDAPATFPGSVNARVAAVQSQVNDIQNTPAYSNTTTYAANTLVSYEGSIYQAKSTTTGNLPTNTTYWLKVGEYASLGGIVAAHTTQIGNVVSDLGAEVTARQALSASFNDPVTGLAATRSTLTTNYYTKADTNSAISSATTTLVSTSALNNALGNYPTTAALVNDYYTKADTNSAISSATQYLVSTTGLTNALNSYPTTATLTNNYYTKTDTNSAISQATQNLVSTTGLNTALSNYTSSATLSTNYYTKTEANTAISNATTNLVSTTALTNALGSYPTTATLSTNYYTKTEANTAISNATLNLVSSNTLANYPTTATLTNNYYTKTDTDGAISSASTTLRSQFRGISLFLPLEQWVLNGQSIVSVTGGVAGTIALRLAGIGGAYPNQGNFVPINTAKKYRVRFWARPSSDAAGVLYFSLRQFTNNNAGSPGPVNGGRSPYKPSGISRATHLSTYGDTWGEYNYLWTASDWQSGATYFQPEFLDNYSGGAGYWDIQGFTLYDVTDVDSVSAALQVLATTTAGPNGQTAQYTVKTDVNGYVSGFGLSSAGNTAGPTTSTFAVRSDAFYIASPTGPGVAPTMPFIVRTTPVNIGGVEVPVGVYITDGYIQNGTITNAKIANLAVDSAKIASITADKIIAGSINVGQYIQSSNYVAGSAGWKIDGGGSAEFGAASIRGQLTASQIDTRGLSIKDSAGNVIFAAGTPLSTANITGLGTLATANSVAASSVTGLGTLATANTVAASSVTGLGTLATANTVAASSVTGLGTLATASSVNWSTQITNIPSFGNFAFLSSITSANISTYIASAAIGEAYIADASITNAKIGTAAVSNAKIGNFIASSDFNGTIDGNGNITDNGTVGWAVAKGNGASGKAVFQNIVARGDIEVPAASIGSAKIAELAVGRLQIVGGAITFTSIVELENTWPSSAMGERQIGFVDFSAAAQDAALLKLYVQPTSPGSASVTQLGNSKLQISTDAVTWTTIGETASYQSPDPENPFLQPAGVVTTNGYPIRLAPVTYGAPTRGYWWGTGDRTRALLTELSVWPANNFGGTVTMQFVFLIPNAGTYRLYYCADDILSSGNFGTPQSGIVNLSYFAWSYTTPNVLTYTTNGPNQIATLNVTCTDTGGLEGFAAYFVNTATEIANSTEGALWTVRRPNYVTSVYKYARVLATRFDSSTNPNVNAWLGVEIIRK